MATNLLQGLKNTFSGTVSFGGDQKSSWLPFAIIGGIVLVLLVRSFGFVSIGKIFKKRKR